MKAAWKIIEAKCPWITCTCCAPHVLSLELKDMAKIPQVAGVLNKVARVLDRFWGRKRWARTKLREVAKKNHKRDVGLWHATGDKLVYCHEALHMKAKLQKAAYAQCVEKWDSDSDSDESEDEMDLAV